MKVVHLLAQKYAQAFLHLHHDTLSSKDLDHLQKVKTILADNHSLGSLLNLANQQDQKKMLALLTKQYIFSASCTQLWNLLCTHRRLFLLEAVIESILYTYNKKHAIADATITSSHALLASEQKAVEKFFAEKTGLKILYTSAVDPTLIVGIRIQSATFLWERSLRKNLQNTVLPLLC
ncbi:MAG TPA: ATP synthase F1 subunit delta [Candidatus Bathyarchaeia archaeon]|nr:ATP synthase F1 subunit delta [Candidatus Bathyarchaeia archaeon]